MAYYGHDKYGNKIATIAVVEKDGKFPRGYVEIGNKLYKVTASQGKKDTKKGDPIRYWVTLQEVQKRSSSGGRGRMTSL